MDILDRLSQEVHRIVENMNFTMPQVPRGLRVPPSAERVLARFNDKVKLRPFTKNNVLYYYLPAHGLVSYSALAIHVMHPNLLSSIFVHRNLTNILLLSAGCGAGLWIWSRPHMSAAAPARRFSWAFLCGSMWSLGSILLWAVMKISFVSRPAVAIVAGLTSGAVLTYTGIDYLNYVDLMLTGGIINEDFSDQTAQSDDEKYDLDM